MARCPFAVWHSVGYDGGAYTGGPYRIVLHTTEGDTAEGALAIFDQHYAPQFVVDENTVYQMIDTDRAGAALQHHSDPQTNRLSCVQIEMVGYAGRPKPETLLSMVRKLLRWIEATHGVPRVWPNGPCKLAIFGQDPGGHNRSVTGWLRGGYFGHEHVPENIHWDPALTADEQAYLMADAVPVPAPRPVPPPAPDTYTVLPGNNLWSIAHRFHTTAGELERINSIPPPYTIQIGQVLKISGAAPRLRFGKRPARGQMRFALQHYAPDLSSLPQPPAEFTNVKNSQVDLGVLGNDLWGDCVWAGADHETMLWSGMAGGTAEMSDDGALADYTAVTGFTPDDPSTDQGTDMLVAASYRRRIGIVDAAGVRHKVGAYVSLTPRSLQEHLLAAWSFGCVGIGLTISGNQIDQFSAGEPWDGPLSEDAGGHYVPLVGYEGGFLQVVTWGKVHRVSTSFFLANNDESVCYLSEEMLKSGVGPSGLNLAQLQADIAKLP